MSELDIKNKYIDTALIASTIADAVIGIYPKDYSVFNYIFNRTLYSRFAVTDVKRRLMLDLYVHALTSRKEYIVPADMKVTPDDLHSAYAVLVYDSPELMHFEYKYTIHTDMGLYLKKVDMYYVSDTFNSLARLASAMSFFRNTFAGKNANSAFGLEMLLHDALCNKCNYVHTSNSQNAYGVLKEGQAVCAGYSRAFSLGMLLNGIPCCSVAGSLVFNGGMDNHEWNLINLDGEFYYVDVTNDDVTHLGIYGHYAFLNVTDAELKKTYVLSKDITRFFVPKCNSVKYNFYNYYGKIVRNPSEALSAFYRDLDSIVSSGRKTGVVTMKFTSQKDMLSFVQNLSKTAEDYIQRKSMPRVSYNCIKADPTCVTTIAVNFS